VNKDVWDSRSWKSSDASFGTAAAASAEAYLRQHFPTTAAIGRVSRNANRRTDGCSSRKAMVNCGRGVDHPKLSYNFMRVSNGRVEIKVDRDTYHWSTPLRDSGKPLERPRRRGIVREGTLLSSMLFLTTPNSRTLKKNDCRFRRPARTSAAAYKYCQVLATGQWVSSVLLGNVESTLELPQPHQSSCGEQCQPKQRAYKKGRHLLRNPLSARYSRNGLRI